MHLLYMINNNYSNKINRMRNFYPFSAEIFSPQNGGFRRARLGKSRGMIRERKHIF